MSLNNLFDTNQDSDDDNEDEDFKPENEVLSDNSDNGSEEEDETDIRSKRESNAKEKEEKEEEELTSEQLKQKSDTLWEEFRKDLPKSNQSNDSMVSDNSNPQTTRNSEKITVTKTYDFAGEEVKVTEEVANTSKSDKQSDNSKEEPPKAIKRTGGLGSVLSQLKKPKISVLQKTAIDWKSFKQNKGIEAELDQHNRSKDTFVERQAFLQRTDLRQFEIEKQIREKNRSQRQLSKD